ncbi:MAG: hemerythrin family protein [Nitrospirota bacterium]
MKWTQDMAVGIETIDEQHKELFMRISDLLQAIRERRCKSEIDGTIKFLDDYARFHFSEEEKRMQAAGFDGLADHRKHHAEYLNNIKELKDLAAQPRIQGMSYELSVTTNQVVVDWIVYHIMKVDRKFGEYVKSRR